MASFLSLRRQAAPQICSLPSPGLCAVPLCEANVVACALSLAFEILHHGSSCKILGANDFSSQRWRQMAVQCYAQSRTECARLTKLVSQISARSLGPRHSLFVYDATWQMRQQTISLVESSLFNYEIDL